MKLVTVFSCFNPMEAHVVRSRLETAGILATVTHETAALTTEGGAMTIGGVRVQVSEEQADDARELLDAPPPTAEEFPQ
jgi:Putative prokaryotic signal transducing protein